MGVVVVSGTLIPSGGLFFYVIEVNWSNESSQFNHLARTTLKTTNGPMRVYAVFSDVDMNPAANGRFFTKQIEAKKFFDVVCDDIKRYGNPLINGMTLEEAHTWADALTPSEYRRIVNPTDYGQDVVYREYAGVQVVGERNSFELLELDKDGEELPLYKNNHDDYFCIRVDLTEHQDENVLAFLYIKERNSLVPVMDELLDTFINVEVVVSSVERLKALMGLPVDSD